MKLSTRARYGLRAMLELAESYGDGPVLARTIAAKQEISDKYLHSLLTMLTHAGLVRSVRGAGGGYTLTRHPSKITVCEVVKILEGSLSLVECVKDEGVCERASDCPARDIWGDVSRAIDRALSNLTLENVVARAQKKDSGRTMYHI